jgi:hypothetical protein
MKARVFSKEEAQKLLFKNKKLGRQNRVNNLVYSEKQMPTISNNN